MIFKTTGVSWLGQIPLQKGKSLNIFISCRGRNTKRLCYDLHCLGVFEAFIVELFALAIGWSPRKNFILIELNTYTTVLTAYNWHCLQQSCRVKSILYNYVKRYVNVEPFLTYCDTRTTLSTCLSHFVYMRSKMLRESL